MLTKILNEARDTFTAYICVLCGSVFNSREYHWGAGEGNETGANARGSNWSCPVCGGVVVEYARVPGPGKEQPNFYAAMR